MTPENRPFERLMDYLTNRMTEPDRLAFEAELAQNPALRRALDEERTLRDGISAATIRQKFRAIHDELIEDGTIQPAESLLRNSSDAAEPDNEKAAALPMGRVRPLWVGLSGWQVAAGLALLAMAGAGLYLWQTPQPTASHTISQQTVPIPKRTTPTPAPVSPIEPPVTVAQNRPKPAPKSPIKEAFAYFQTLTAELSIDRQLAQLATDEPTRGERSEVEELADGRRLLRTGDTTAAIDVLLPLANAPTGDEWTQSAQWYLAGAYLKAGRLAEAQELLQKIANTDQHPQQALAQKLLQHKK